MTATDFLTAARFADQAGIGLRAGDALHLAVASAHDASLCTLDRPLLEAAPAAAVSARRPPLNRILHQHKSWYAP